MRIVQQTLDELKVESHPDKTFVRRVERGISFLGYEMNAAGLTGVARPTWNRFVERVTRLYEQGASWRCIGDYVRRWLVWLVSGFRLPSAYVDVDIRHCPASGHPCQTTPLNLVRELGFQAQVQVAMP